MRWHQHGAVGNLQAMLIEVLHWWCPLRAVFCNRGFRAAHGPPAKTASPVQALVPRDPAQLSLQKAFLYNRQTLSTDTSGSVTLSRKANCCPWSWSLFPSSMQAVHILRTSSPSHLLSGGRGKCIFPPSRPHLLLFSCLSCYWFSLIASFCYKLSFQAGLECCNLV